MLLFCKSHIANSAIADPLDRQFPVLSILGVIIFQLPAVNDILT
jgi:hypothetical protein